ncbi:hypothetical protein B1750_gp107 [Noumeavirus]|uniref:hypothetical protein n=1 Tax=Noumeavirus TaxID=1955558 RepID=UPI000982D67A|nr:hypothetical protein B1750_gp107 [Noumeavirus]AQM73088.1 hypothetical protein NMV_107 [Noumeavirus]QZX43884.1 hypothetical protein MarQu_302 [Marseillevirus sp.]
MSTYRELREPDEHISVVIATLKEEFSLKDKDVYVFINRGVQHIEGPLVAVYQLFSGDDELVCSWEKILLNGQEAHVWGENKPLSPKQLAGRVSGCARRSLYFSLKATEARVKKLEKENKELREELSVFLCASP